MSDAEPGYRRWVKNELRSFQVRAGQSDLHISAEQNLSELAQRVLHRVRGDLEAYLRRDPEFGTALTPRDILPGGPPVVQEMAAAARTCGVGPMAAVAGAIAQQVGQALLAESRQVIVENGGDIFIYTTRPRVAAVFADRSPLSGRIGVRISRLRQPLGLCTSSGTVGPSLSFGRADAALVLATSAALADAAATALGNRIQEESDISPSLEGLRAIDGILAAVVVLGEHLGAWGEVEITPVHPRGPS